jgi:hypothetical protein
VRSQRISDLTNPFNFGMIALAIEINRLPAPHLHRCCAKFEACCVSGPCRSRPPCCERSGSELDLLQVARDPRRRHRRHDSLRDQPPLFGPIILSVASGAPGALGRGPKSSIDRRSPCGRAGTNLTRRRRSESQLWARCINSSSTALPRRKAWRGPRAAHPSKIARCPRSRMVMVVNLAGAVLLS